MDDVAPAAYLRPGLLPLLSPSSGRNRHMKTNLQHGSVLFGLLLLALFLAGITADNLASARTTHAAGWSQTTNKSSPNGGATATPTPCPPPPPGPWIFRSPEPTAL